MDDTMLDQFLEDAEPSKSAPTNEQLQTLAGLLSQLQDLEARVENLKQQSSEANAELWALKTRHIPDFLAQFGLSEIRLADGSFLTVKPDCEVSIPKDKRHEAYAWLEERGHGDLIKRGFNIRHGRTDQERAALTKEILEQAGIEYEEVREIHPQTLKAFAREEISRGRTFPDDLIKVAPYQVAKLK